MNQLEEKMHKNYNNWTDIVGLVREKLIAICKKIVPEDINSYEYPVPEDLKEVIVKSEKNKKPLTLFERNEPKYKVGRYLYRYLYHPKNALRKNQLTAQAIAVFHGFSLMLCLYGDFVYSSSYFSLSPYS
jgi:hypothetical protein